MPTTTPLPEGALNLCKKWERSSKEIDAVQAALARYATASTRSNLLAFTHALGAWKLSKARRAGGGWTASKRAAVIHLLDKWLVLESEARGIFPTSRSLWGNTHNCYAYAMKCKAPLGLGQNSWPGKFANHQANGDFLSAVEADARHQRHTGEVLQTLPLPVPPRLMDGTYLVAMVANGNGYHFLRRRESTGLWSHKNGGSSPVLTHFHDASLEQPVAITDDVVARILQNPRLIGCDMQFKGYLRIAAAGLQVKG